MIGEEIRASVFRDTRSFYEQVPAENVARQLLAFARRHAGHEILDLGCAVGNYARVLGAMGYAVKGADVNARYVQIARERGVDAHLVEGNRLPFPDRAFDTVLMFEVLEHLSDPGPVLEEARRVARRNVLVTTPNSGRVDELQRSGLLFEHFADLDHRNFFTEGSLRGLLEPYFAQVQVRKGDGINPLALIGTRPVRFLGKALTRLGILRPHFHYRLFAVGTI